MKKRGGKRDGARRRELSKENKKTNTNLFVRNQIIDLFGVTKIKDMCNVFIEHEAAKEYLTPEVVASYFAYDLVFAVGKAEDVFGMFEINTDTVNNISVKFNVSYSKTGDVFNRVIVSNFTFLLFDNEFKLSFEYKIIEVIKSYFK